MFLSPFFGGCKDSKKMTIHKVINKKAPANGRLFSLDVKQKG